MAAAALTFLAVVWTLFWVLVLVANFQAEALGASIGVLLWAAGAAALEYRRRRSR